MCFCFGSSANVSDETDDKYFSTLRRDNLSIGSKVIEEAKKNDPSSLFSIGEAYFNAGLSSEAVKTSSLYKKALYWYQKSAYLGYPDAQFNLGYMYENGYGQQEEDYGLAIENYFTASTLGYTAAFYKLGYMYEKGLGVEQNDKEAFEWYGKAAEQGDMFAQFKIGTMYRDGTGVAMNCIMALTWFTRCANEGEEDAKIEVAMLKAEGYSLENEDEEIKSLTVKRSKVNSRNNSIIKKHNKDADSEKKEAIQNRRLSRISSKTSYHSIINEKIEHDNQESLPQSIPVLQTSNSYEETERPRFKGISNPKNKNDGENRENDLIYDSEDSADNDLCYDDPSERRNTLKKH